MLPAMISRRRSRRATAIAWCAPLQRSRRPRNTSGAVAGVGIAGERVARRHRAVVDDRPVAAAGPSRVADRGADGGVVQSPRAEPSRRRHVAGIDGPHVGLHLRHVAREHRREIRQPAEVVDHVERAAAPRRKRPVERQRVAEVAPARPLAFAGRTARRGRSPRDPGAAQSVTSWPSACRRSARSATTRSMPP